MTGRTVSSRGSLLLLVSRFSSSHSGSLIKPPPFRPSFLLFSPFLFFCDDIQANWKISYGDGVLSFSRSLSFQGGIDFKIYIYIKGRDIDGGVASLLLVTEGEAKD